MLAAVAGGVVGCALGALLTKRLAKDELPDITAEEVKQRQDAWADAIVRISAAHAAKEDFKKVAEQAAGELYGYEHGDVLFKPTKATEHPFRETAAGAMSYFVGGDIVEGGYPGEDKGFAINGGRRWSKVWFENHKVQLDGKSAIAMGSYHFIDATDEKEVRVEYTFGYKRNADGKVRIFLHHSSVPFSA